jgi:hypothetical protein
MPIGVTDTSAIVPEKLNLTVIADVPNEVPFMVRVVA